MAARQDWSRLFTSWAILAGHLHDDLDPTFVRNAVGKQLAHRRGKRVFPCVSEREDLLQGCCTRDGSVLVGPANRGTLLLDDRLFVSLAVFQAIPDVSDRKLVACAQPAPLDPLSVDPDPVCRAEVSHSDLAVILAHAAMLPRNAQRVETCVARRVTAHHHHDAVQRDVWTFIDGHKSYGHGETSSTKAVGGDEIVIVRQKLKRHYRSVVVKQSSAKLTDRYDPTARFVRSAQNLSWNSGRTRCRFFE
jgi:hypothetical protein